MYNTIYPSLILYIITFEHVINYLGKSYFILLPFEAWADCGPGFYSNLLDFQNTTTQQYLLTLTSISAHSTFVAHHIHLGLCELHYYDFHYSKENLRKGKEILTEA